MSTKTGETSTNLLSQCRPITCIEVVENFILICEGPGISILTKNGTKVTQKIIAPSHKTILGVSVWNSPNNEGTGQKYFIFAFGQHFYRLVCFDPKLGQVYSILRNKNINFFGEDEISFIAARWLNDGQKLAAITDENVLHIFDWGVKINEVSSANSSGSNLTRRIVRGVTTSLFCATLSGNTEEDLIAFSGTNLSSVYVWAPQDSRANYHLQIEGIKGSVLSVKYNSSKGILVASSDQRSVFAWKLINTDCVETENPNCVQNIQASSLIKNQVQVRLISEMVGHTGRVWHVDVKDEQIISAGQDSNFLLWDANGKLLKIFSSSSVLSIRCCRFDPWENSAYSGADDGSVCRWSLSDALTTKTLPIKLNWELNEEKKNTDKIIHTQNDKSKNKNKILVPEVCLRQVLSYDCNHFLVSKSSGQFVLTNLDGTTWQIYENPQFLNYNVCAFSPDKKYLAIGSKNGYLGLIALSISPSKIEQRKEEPSFDYSECDLQLDPGFIPLVGSCYHQKKYNSKIVSIHWADDATLVVGTCTQVFVILRDSDSHSNVKEESVQWVKFFQFVTNSKNKDKPGVSAAIKIVVTSPKSLKSDSEVTYMVIGDEFGSLHIFKLGQEGELPLHTKPKVHGTYGVCDLKHDIGEGEFWSVGRNKSIIHFKLEDDTDDAEGVKLIILEVIESGLNWNARLYRSQLGSLVCGFSENDFVMVDLEADRIVKKVSCGGAHRSWDIAINNDIVTFGFIRHKQLTVTRFGLDSTNIKNGIYGGKTINVITTFPFPNKSQLDPSNTFCVVTGGEEGVLRLTSASIHSSNFVSEPNGVSCSKLAKFKGHASSIRVIKCRQVSEDCVLVLSAGGRSQVIASLIRFEGNENIVWSKESSIMLLESRKNDTDLEFPDSDMRIMDIHIDDPQQILMPVTSNKTLDDQSQSQDQNQNQYQLSFPLLCACSDGLVRRLSFNLSSQNQNQSRGPRSKFTLLQTFNFGISTSLLNSSSSPATNSTILHAITQISLIQNPRPIPKPSSRSTAICANSVGELVLFPLPAIANSDSNKDLLSALMTTAAKTAITTSVGTSIVEEIYVRKIRKSGITAMDTLYLESGSDNLSKFYTVIGSDDGVLALYLVTVNTELGDIGKHEDDDGSVEIKCVWEDRIHHSAAINSVSIADSSVVFVVASSADQVVTVRNVEGDKLKWFRCGVMDVQDMNVVCIPNNLISQSQTGQEEASVCPKNSSSFSVAIFLVGQGFEIRGVDF